MGNAIEGFYSTWDSTRQNFGVGTPKTGEDFDNSSTTLRGLDSHMAAAAPGNRWTGTAATAYDAANTEHRSVITQIADLDKRMATEVTNAAQVVTTGRQNLDAIKQQVAAAEASVPPGNAGEALRMRIAQTGLARIQEIIQKTNAESNAIGGRIQALDGEYQKLGIQKFAPKEGGGPLGIMSEEEKKAQVEKQAKEDVQKTLNDGDQEAAARVEKVLGTVAPYRELTPEQSAYLNEMQSQQHGMSVADLKSAEDRLQDKGHVIGDSWQLMSNDDVPRSAGAFDDQQKGGFDRLPQSVQDAIKSPIAVPVDNQLKDITAIVKDGNPNLQTGTELDRELMRRADRIMDTPLFTDGSVFAPGEKADFLDDTVNDIFDSAGRDHQIINDQITGNHGDDGQDFLHDVTHHEWNDDGKAAGGLFEWTKDSTGPEKTIAAETANVYADYLGTHSGELLSIDGNRQIGDLNPELVKAFSTGLLPYQEEMVTDQPTVDTPFDRIDDLTGPMDKTKGLFAVIDSQHEAAVEWNRSAYQNALDMQQSFADYAHAHPDLYGDDPRADDLQSSARLLGAIDGGINQETLSNINNGNLTAEQALTSANDAHAFKTDMLRSIFSYGPGGDLVTNAFADQLAGPPPDPNDFTFDQSGTATDVGLSSAESSVQSQITQAQYTVASEFFHRGDSPAIPDRFFNPDGSLMAPNQISEADWSLYDARLTASMAEHPAISAMMQKFSGTFVLVGGKHE